MLQLLQPKVDRLFLSWNSVESVVQPPCNSCHDVVFLDSMEYDVCMRTNVYLSALRYNTC